MRCLRQVSAALIVPAWMLLAVGCGSDKPTEKPTASSSGSGSSAKKESGGKASGSGGKEEVASKGSGTVKGRVVYDGDPPKPAPLDINKDQDTCHKGPKEELLDPTWRVGPDKGVANVVVWVQAPANKYFKIPDNLKSHSTPVTVDQPFCAFEPHVFVLYPTYFDGKEQKPTGEKLLVKNSAPITHNSNISFSDAILNKGGANPLLKSGGSVEISDIHACKDKDCSKTSDVSISCNIHQWMKAFGKIFDHPFVAVSSGGKSDAKEFGNFEIKDAPAGAEVSIMYWHESMDKPAEFKKVTLKEGANDLGEIKIKK